MWLLERFAVQTMAVLNTIRDTLACPPIDTVSRDSPSNKGSCLHFYYIYIYIYMYSGLLPSFLLLPDGARPSP
jgi:hypothetical protein